MTSREVVQSYLDRGFQLVFWPDVGDAKGPSGLSAKGWLERAYTLDDYRDGWRVGIMHGVEISPGKFVVDVDIDWGPGVEIAKALLPATSFIWGRSSKRISHCLYTCSDVIPMYAYKDVNEDGKDGKTLIEFRPDKHQSMAPPSIWEKEGKREPLAFVVDKELTHVESASHLKQRVCLSAIGMLLALHLGKNGFGHETRLAWAGFLMRLGMNDDDLLAMGLAISRYCTNDELSDVQRVILSTRASLQKENKKVKGGPALAKLIGEGGKAIVARINEWVGHDSDFIRDEQGFIIARNQENVRRAIELLGHELTYNEFSDKMLVDGRPMEDREVNGILTRIEIELHFQPPENYFERIIKFLAWSHPFHPVKEYLDGLTWDGVLRLDSWLIDAADAADTPYVRAISAIMLIAAVKRIRKPGCKYDEMVVWESEQGSLKSSACAALCPDPAWFSDDLPLNLKSQQLIETTLGKWIIEASDLAGKRRTEIEQLKAMLSRQVDGPARMAYAHFAVERPRHFIIIGTTNSKVWLVDPTGGRRFWPMPVGKFDVEWIKTNRDQLWAEASAREAAGESIRLKEELWPVASEHQEARREVAMWDALQIPVERRDRSGSLRISDIMQRLGFKRTTVRVPDEGAQAGYVTEDESKLEIPGESTQIAMREPGEDPPF